jgi:membrane-associated protease RseP (regulator of RpoE activity)
MTMSRDQPSLGPQSAKPQQMPALQPMPAALAGPAKPGSRPGGKSRSGLIVGALLIGALAIGGGAIGTGLVHVPGFGHSAVTTTVNSPGVNSPGTAVQTAGDTEAGTGQHYIGMWMHTLTPADANSPNLAGRPKEGVQLQHIYGGGPLDAAGLRANDIIVAIDGVPVRSLDQVQIKIRMTEIGDTFNVTADRNGVLISAPVRVGKWTSDTPPCSQERCSIEQQ